MKSSMYNDAPQALRGLRPWRPFNDSLSSENTFEHAPVKILAVYSPNEVSGTTDTGGDVSLIASSVFIYIRILAKVLLQPVANNFAMFGNSISAICRHTPSDTCC